VKSIGAPMMSARRSPARRCGGVGPRRLRRRFGTALHFGAVGRRLRTEDASGRHRHRSPPELLRQRQSRVGSLGDDRGPDGSSQALRSKQKEVWG
jgi:hypothetical protein